MFQVKGRAKLLASNLFQLPRLLDLDFPILAGLVKNLTIVDVVGVSLCFDLTSDPKCSWRADYFIQLGGPYKSLEPRHIIDDLFLPGLL